VNPGAVAPSAAAWCAGCPGVDARLRAVAERAAAAAHIAVAPLYVLNYIFDGDELDEEDMLRGTEETAQYSVHVVGLLFLGAARCVCICDGNGPLLPGGNMEFLALPLARSGAHPTTAVSAYDRDQRAASKKGKRRS
jgi:hypothetical protein